MTNPYPLAVSLARPVARGYLSLDEANACLLAAALRDGSPYEAIGTWRLLQHIMGLHVANEQQRQNVAAYRMRRRLQPLIALRKPPNVLLAEAHDINGAAGFPFDERTVNELASLEMHAARPQFGRHGYGR